MIYDIIDKFNNASDQLIVDMVNESLYNTDLKLQLLSKKEGSVLKIDNYEVRFKKVNLTGYSKTFYDVVRDDEIIYNDICLSISLISLLKNLISNKPENHNTNILILDRKYSAILGDILLYKQLIKTVKSPIKKSILLAKYEGRYDSSVRIKDQIEKNYK